MDWGILDHFMSWTGGLSDFLKDIDFQSGFDLQIPEFLIDVVEEFMLTDDGFVFITWLKRLLEPAHGSPEVCAQSSANLCLCQQLVLGHHRSLLDKVAQAVLSGSSEQDCCSP